MATMSRDEIYKKVQAVLVDALGVDEEEVTPGATMVGDLGAESIDFLDIVFKLEKAFGIEIPRKELSPEDILTNADFVKDGKVTPNGIVELKRRMPFVGSGAWTPRAGYNPGHGAFREGHPRASGSFLLLDA